MGQESRGRQKSTHRRRTCPTGSLRAYQGQFNVGSATVKTPVAIHFNRSGATHSNRGQRRTPWPLRP
ncbi:MAG TPA: hypothetical protein VFF53_09255 [Geobacteraceae bacterium]|nr:hypothetical protein [Geobacteraceae bacterium]